MEYRKIKLNIPNLRFEYSIDTEGIVRCESTGKVLKGTSITKRNRYVKIHLDKVYKLHRLVAEHFIPNTENKLQVNHCNGDRLDNRVVNLEWSTASENVVHAYDTGLKTNHGMKNPFRKLNEDDVKRIWALRYSKMTAQQIRDHLNLTVSVACVKVIRSGKNWSSVTDKLT